jgi:TldD protein
MALPGRYISLDTWTTEKYIVSSDGTEVRLRTPRVAMDLFLMAKDGERTGQRSLQLGESAGWEGVERWDLPNRLSYEATQLTKVLSQGRAMGTERCDVVLGPELVGIVCHESSGHPSEADRMLGRESAQAGETFLDRRSLGQVIGSELVNVVDDPTLPRSFGLYPCDDEGVRARKRYLIKRGKVESLLHNRETAHEMGTTSNGSSRSVAYNREPIVRMANTYLEPGDHSFEELIADVRHGIYIRNFMEWNIDDRRFNQSFVGLEAYRIKAGRLEGMVRNPRIEMTTPALWSAVDAVGDDLSFTAAYCGKGDPVQAIPVWTGGPHLRLRDVVVGGSA